MKAKIEFFEAMVNRITKENLVCYQTVADNNDYYSDWYVFRIYRKEGEFIGFSIEEPPNSAIQQDKLRNFIGSTWCISRENRLYIYFNPPNLATYSPVYAEESSDFDPVERVYSSLISGKLFTPKSISVIPIVQNCVFDDFDAQLNGIVNISGDNLVFENFPIHVTTCGKIHKGYKYINAQEGKLLINDKPFISNTIILEKLLTKLVYFYANNNGGQII